MKKDKFIEKKLNEYVSSIKPPNGIISDALNVMKGSRSKTAMRTFSMQRFFKVGTSIAAAIVVLFFVFNKIDIIRKGNNLDSEVVEYNLADLGKKSITFSEVSQKNENILFLDIKNMSANCNLFYDRNSDNTLMISVKYKILSESGMDEVFVIADLNNSFKELEYFKKFGVVKRGDISIYAKEFYENGEYYTHAYFRKNDIDYYVIMMSPSYGQDEFYLNKLLFI